MMALNLPKRSGAHHRKPQSSNGSYLDLVDSIKYTQLKDLSAFFGMDLSLYTLRMPLSTLKQKPKTACCIILFRKATAITHLSRKLTLAWAAA